MNADLRLIRSNPDTTRPLQDDDLNDFEAYLLGLAIERHVQDVADQEREGRLTDHERRELQQGARDMFLRRARGSNDRIRQLRDLGRGQA